MMSKSTMSMCARPPCTYGWLPVARITASIPRWRVRRWPTRRPTAQDRLLLGTALLNRRSGHHRQDNARRVGLQVGLQIVPDRLDRNALVAPPVAEPRRQRHRRMMQADDVPL